MSNDPEGRPRVPMVAQVCDWHKPKGVARARLRPRVVVRVEGDMLIFTDDDTGQKLAISMSPAQLGQLSRDLEWARRAKLREALGK